MSSNSSGSGGTPPPVHEQPFSSSPRPPPLPLSTSSFAFERPGLDTTGDMPSSSSGHGNGDASISFIHQPNPDYAAVDEAESTSSRSSTSSSSSSTEPALTGDTASVTGEIISVLDDATGQGWTRHTRVYGGGVCLACLAAESSGEGNDNDDFVGRYGDSVPMEDRR